MEFNLFIIPTTMIVAQLIKTYIPTKHIPLFAVIFGLLAGLAYGGYYGQDLFVHAIEGAIYGASSAGIYDLGKNMLGSA